VYFSVAVATQQYTLIKFPSYFRSQSWIIVIADLDLLFLGILVMEVQYI
jgi:hypothetical protein